MVVIDGSVGLHAVGGGDGSTLCSPSEFVISFQINKMFSLFHFVFPLSVPWLHSCMFWSDRFINSPVYFVCLVAVGVGEHFVWNRNGSTVLFGWRAFVLVEFQVIRWKYNN